MLKEDVVKLFQQIEAICQELKVSRHIGTPSEPTSTLWRMTMDESTGVGKAEPFVPNNDFSLDMVSLSLEDGVKVPLANVSMHHHIIRDVPLTVMNLKTWLEKNNSDEVTKTLIAHLKSYGYEVI